MHPARVRARTKKWSVRILGGFTQRSIRPQIHVVGTFPGCFPLPTLTSSALRRNPKAPVALLCSRLLEQPLAAISFLASSLAGESYHERRFYLRSPLFNCPCSGDRFEAWPYTNRLGSHSTLTVTVSSPHMASANQALAPRLASGELYHFPLPPKRPWQDNNGTNFLSSANRWDMTLAVLDPPS